MHTLTELYNQVIVPKDAELEKQAAEMWKQAEEEDAAGRIMARGFADELSKLANEDAGMAPPKPAAAKLPAAPKPAAKPNMGEGLELGGRKSKAPKMPNIASGTGQFGKGNKVAPAGQIR